MIYDLLYDWQKEIVDKLESKKSFGLWVDMGCGKTPLSLALCEKHCVEKLLIVSINAKATEKESEAGSWFNWLSKSSTKFNYIQKNSKKGKFVDEPTAMLINYESLFKHGKSVKLGFSLADQIVEFIESCKGKTVGIIIDESHKMKNQSSKQYKALDLIKKKIKLICKDLYIYLLTGTPFTQGFIDVYAQLKYLDCPMNKTAFVEAFCIKGNVPGLQSWEQPIVGYKNIPQLYELIHQYAITMKATDVVKLPDKLIVEHNLPESDDFKLFLTKKLPYDDILSENNRRIDRGMAPLDVCALNSLTTKHLNYNPWFKNFDYPEFRYMCDTPAALWLRARQLSIGFQGNAEQATWYNYDRLNALSKFLETNPDNYVLFYNYTPELVEIYNICVKLGYNVDIYCGDIKSLVYYEKFAAASESDKMVNTKNIIIANFASGSTGKNWQEYNKCIIFSIPLYKDYEQGIKRIHRIGQTNNVTYHIFKSDNWLDNDMMDNLNKGINYSVEMFNTKLNIL